MGFSRAAGLKLHACFRWNRTLSQAYLSAWAWILGFLPDRAWLKRHLGNNLRGVAWPAIALPPRDLLLAEGVSVKVVPEPGSLGFRAIYEHRLGHEREVFDWLAPRLSAYDAVLEIGANVGVYTLLFSRVLQGSARSPCVFSFEPSPLAYARLQRHLQLNDCANVRSFNCAVSSRAGNLDFHENARDMMKGSLEQDVAAQFPGARPPIKVPCMTGEQLAPLLELFSTPLLKVDVMGHEAEVLMSLRSLIESKRPDILLGVWQRNLQGLNGLGFLRGRYRLSRIGPGGLMPRETFSDPDYCNYFLSAA